MPQYHRLVLAVLALVFFVVPFLELYLILQVGHVIGAFNTVGVLVAVSLLGAWLVKHEGIGVVRKARRQMELGRVPGVELVDGVLIVVAGALLVSPGFLTDVVGVLLLLPPVRAMVRTAARKRLDRRVSVYGTYEPPPFRDPELW